jgi:hypothetical protein
MSYVSTAISECRSENGPGWVDKAPTPSAWRRSGSFKRRRVRVIWIPGFAWRRLPWPWSEPWPRTGLARGHSSRPPRQFSRAYRARELNAADDWLSSWKPHPLIAIRPWVWLNGASEKVKARQGQSSLESALMQHITPLLHRDNPPSLSLSGPLSL